ncbi:MAG: phosphate ABC transporter substrate-binding protein PstS [Pseudonocardiaceae bacterium]
MTSATTAPTSGPAVPPESARRVKSASGGADQVFRRPLRGAYLLVLLIMPTIGAQLVFAPAAFAQGFVSISGAGSTSSFNAIDQRRRDVDNLFGIKVNFSPSGSSDGRNQFKNGTVDFAVSEIEYGLTDGGVVDLPPAGRPFGYMPIVAGGTAFMYNLKIGNQRVTNLRLSGDVIAKIFSKQITDWSDAAIKADNTGLTLPARPIVPVVRSDGSGLTAQFSRWMAAEHGGIWDAYCGRPNCGFTSNFPVRPGVEARSGSQGVAGFVAQDSSEGTITYVEYSSAKNVNFPGVKVLNEAGYHVEPKASNVALALLKVQLNPDLTQDLSQVYLDADPRSYPLSSYSYMIFPKGTEHGFTNEKGRTLSEFAYYFLCEGQQQAEALGYAPLPVNLVQAGVDQVAEIPGSTNKLSRNDLKTCNNPTFSPDGTDLLAKNTPQPPECDRKGGFAQCTTGTGGAQPPTPPCGSPTPSPGNTPMPPRGPPTPPPGDTSCLAAIRMLLEGLPRAVGETARNGNGRWVWRVHLADEVAATATRTDQRHLPAHLRCDSLLKRVAKTAGSAPVQVIDR